MAIDKKYLVKNGNTWQLNYRLPSRFGGELLKVSLRTADIKRARFLRDEFTSLFSYNETATRIAEKLLEIIEDKTTNNNKLIQKYKSHLFTNDEVVTLSDAVDKYITFLTKANLRKATFKSYRAVLTTSFEILDPNIPLDQITKDNAIAIREHHVSRISPTRVKFNFQQLRQFFKYCKAEGLCLRDIDQEFEIALPKVHKKATAIIPEEAADKAAALITEWIAPRIARYTGCRLMEILRLTDKDIVTESGIECFRISEESKTHKPRLVPIAEKLKPHIINFKKVAHQRHGSEKWNKLVKKIPGCEKCSFHSWRVYCISQLHKNNVDPYVIKTLVGHAAGSNDVHAVYTRIFMQQLKEAVDTIF